MKNADMPAMPCAVTQKTKKYEHGQLVGIQSSEIKVSGLSKREYFAAMAMQGLLAADYEDGSKKTCEEDIALQAKSYADTLLEALEEQ